MRWMMNPKHLFWKAARPFDRIALHLPTTSPNTAATNRITIFLVLGELGSIDPPPLKGQPSFIGILASPPARRCPDVGVRMLICVRSEPSCGQAAGSHAAMIRRSNLQTIPHSMVAAALTGRMTSVPCGLLLLLHRMVVNHHEPRVGPLWIRPSRWARSRRRLLPHHGARNRPRRPHRR